MSLFIDMGWGDWRIADSPETRVTAEQVAAVNALANVEGVGSSDVRFGEETGELCAFHTDRRSTVTLISETGETEEFPI